MKPPKSRKAELPPNAMGGGKSHAESAKSAEISEFKMTELGLIPVDWEVKRFDDAYSFAAASDLQKEWYSPIQDARHKYCIYSNGLANNGLYGYTSRPRYNGNSITITGRGTLGHAEFRHDDFDAIIRLLILTPIVGVDNQFVVYWINNYKPFVNESTSIPQLTVPQVACKLFPLPPLAEQRRIAGALSDVDELISALGKLIEKKRNIKTGAMQQLLTGKTRLPGFGARCTEFKQTELGPIPVDWEVMRLGDVCTDYAYGTGAEAVDYDGENKYIRITDIDEDSHLYSPLPLASPSFFSEGHVVKENDLLVARTGASVGKTYFYSKSDGKLIFAGFLMKANVKHAEGKFIFYLTLTDYYKRWVLSESARSGQPGINIRQLQSLLLPLPPLAEQKAIAAALSDMDAEIAALEADRVKYERIKSGMMQELLTGRTRLKGE